MKKLLLSLLVALSFVGCSPSDSELRSKSVKIIGERGLCSGQQVRAKSGIDYILTAGHCRKITSKDSIQVQTEDGKLLERKIISEDPNSDLLLLEGLPNIKGLDLAYFVHKNEHVRTITHGAGYDSYKTEGEIIQKQLVRAILYNITNKEEEQECSLMSKQKVHLFDFFGLFQIKFCVLESIEMVSTAMTVPGSSGGMVVNDYGQLVGIVSAGDTKFSMFVLLQDIRIFLNNY